MPYLFVKESLDIFLPLFTKLINCSLSEGVVSADLKKAVVTLLIKKASLPHDDFKNLRECQTVGLSFRPLDQYCTAVN